MEKTNPIETGPDAKATFYAEHLVLLEILGPSGHATILEELGRLEEPPGPSVADEHDDGGDASPPLAGGPLGHDVGGAEERLPPDAYSSAVWEAACEVTVP